MALRTGDYVNDHAHPEWGLGKIISVGDSGKATVFFLRAGRRTFLSNSPALEQVDAQNPILETAAGADWSRAHRNLYVVELNPKVFDWDRRFFEANLHWIPGRPCVYVGMTGLTPEQRFKAHQRGEHAARIVQKYGLRLVPELYGHFNPLPYELAQQMEPELARQLRADGLAVWHN